MEKTIKAIIDLLNAQAHQWSVMADKYTTIGKILDDENEHAGTIVTYKACAADLANLARAIELRTTKMEPYGIKQKPIDG
jgi:hypothetical protein